jgi:hypothetical protein
VRKADGTDDPLPSADRLDAIMAGIPANRTIRFGPGLFYTRGQTGWQAKDGMRLLGAGMNVTTLRLVGIPYDQFRWMIAATIPLNGFEASDFTVDSNLSGNEETFIGAFAFNVWGNHVHIRRIRVVNWGGKVAGTGDGVIRPRVTIRRIV